MGAVTDSFVYNNHIFGYDWAPALPNIAEVLCPVFASNTDVTIAAMHLVTRMMMMSFMRYESLVFPTTNLLGK